MRLRKIIPPHETGVFIGRTLLYYRLRCSPEISPALSPSNPANVNRRSTALAADSTVFA